ncbi:hypothetical protein KEM48_013539 [Puccinia striiformis f. sp. tritici PST-130]|nr:hypothetical protein KEM48_013539 [Puccinia striiformis f. sp. tritici PST-130]
MLVMLTASVRLYRRPQTKPFYPSVLLWGALAQHLIRAKLRKSCTKHEKLFRTAHKDGESVSTGFIFDPRGTNKVEDKCEWEPYLITGHPTPVRLLHEFQ